MPLNAHAVMRLKCQGDVELNQNKLSPVTEFTENSIMHKDKLLFINSVPLGADICCILLSQNFLKNGVAYFEVLS